MKSLIGLILVSAAVQLVAAFDPSYMLCLVNQERGKSGLPNLGLDDRLNQAAQQHCDFQAETDSMTHDGSSGDSPGTRMTEFGYNWVGCAENISFGQSDEQECMQEWMASPGHRANILGDFTHFGAAVSSSGSTPFYMQDFGNDGQHHDYPACPSGGGGGDDESGSSYGASSYGGGDSSGDGATVTWYDEDGNEVAPPSGSDSNSGSSYGTTTTSSDDGGDGGVTWYDDDGNQVAAPSSTSYDDGSSGDDDGSTIITYD